MKLIQLKAQLNHSNNLKQYFRLINQNFNIAVTIKPVNRFSRRHHTDQIVDIVRTIKV